MHRARLPPSIFQLLQDLSSGLHCLKTASSSLEAWKCDGIRNLLGRKLAFTFFGARLVSSQAMVRFYLSGLHLLCLPQLVTWLKAAYCCLFVYSSPAWRAVSLPSVGPARGTLGSGTWGPQEGLSTGWSPGPLDSCPCSGMVSEVPWPHSFSF